MDQTHHMAKQLLERIVDMLIKLAKVLEVG